MSWKRSIIITWEIGFGRVDKPGDFQRAFYLHQYGQGRAEGIYAKLCINNRVQLKRYVDQLPKHRETNY
jgi:hypothetical protein